MTGAGTLAGAGGTNGTGGSTPPHALRLAAGSGHNCALISDGSARCWGYNSHGQLGDRTTDTRLQPVSVYNLNNAIDLAAGGFVTCAVLTDRSVACWGDGSQGALGNGTQEPRQSPTAVANISNVTSASTLGGTTCAVADSSVQCWGQNANGELGNGTQSATDYALKPVTVKEAGPATQVEVGDQFVCALQTDKSLKCWGKTWYGNSEAETKLTPTTIPFVSGAVQVVSGMQGNVCVRRDDDTILCWGANGLGQVGQNDSADTHPQPTLVSGIFATQITMGIDDVCALLEDGSLKCWGRMSNWFNGEIEFGKTPTAFPLVDKALHVMSSGSSACALLKNQSVWCWGSDDLGQSGNGTTTVWNSTPVKVLDIPGSP